VVIIWFLVLSACRDDNNVIVRTIRRNSSYNIGKRDSNEFDRSFANFYKDKTGHFFIKTAKYNEATAGQDTRFSTIFSEIPVLGSNSFIQDGEYLKDSGKVICIFEIRMEEILIY